MKVSALDYLDKAVVEYFPKTKLTGHSARDLFGKSVFFLEYVQKRKKKKSGFSTEANQYLIDQSRLTCVTNEHAYFYSTPANKNFQFRFSKTTNPQKAQIQHFFREFRITSTLLTEISQGNFLDAFYNIVPCVNELRTGILSIFSGNSTVENNHNSSSSDLSSYFFNLERELIKNMSSFGAKGAGYFFQVVIWVFSVLVEAFDLVFKFTLLAASLYGFLVNENGIVEHASRALVILDSKENLRY